MHGAIIHKRVYFIPHLVPRDFHTIHTAIGREAIPIRCSINPNRHPVGRTEMLRSILQTHICHLLARHRKWQPYLRVQHRQIRTTRDDHFVIAADIATCRFDDHARLGLTYIHNLNTGSDFCSRIPRQRNLRLNNLTTAEKSRIRMEHNHFVI